MAHPAHRRDGQERRIPAEQLVAAVAAEGHRHRGPRVAGQVEGGQERRIGERFVEQISEPRQQRPRVGGGEGELVMLRAQALRHRPGEWFLAVTRLLEADGEALEPLPRGHRPRGGGDGARIDAAAEEDADGHVADQPVPHRRAQGVPQRLGPRARVARRRATGAPPAEGQVPVPVEANPARGHGKRVPGGKLAHAREDRRGIGQVAAGEVAGQPFQIEIAADLGVGEQGPDFRGEHEPPVALGVVEGLFPHPIPGGEERLALGIPQDEGEHPVEMGQAVRAELLPGVDDHLGVGAGGEAVPTGAQGLGEAPEIVDLAVEHGVDGARLVGHGLASGGEVDDREAAVAERHGAVDVVSFIVWAPMAQRGRHPANDRALGAPLIQRDEAAKAAHGRPRGRTHDARASRHAESHGIGGGGIEAT